MKNRIGRFYIADHWVDEHPEGLANVFVAMHFVPLRVEYLYHSRKLECIGLSPNFREVSEPGETPNYELEIKNELGRVFLNSVKRVEDKNELK